MAFKQMAHRGSRKCVLALVGLPICFVFLAAAQADDGGEAVLREYHSGNGLLNRGMHEMAAAEYRKFLGAHADHEHVRIDEMPKRAALLAALLLA